jgi:hypothetical protein
MLMITTIPINAKTGHGESTAPPSDCERMIASSETTIAANKNNRESEAFLGRSSTIIATPIAQAMDGKSDDVATLSAK